jgi:hypothetical protein
MRLDDDSNATRCIRELFILKISDAPDDCCATDEVEVGLEEATYQSGYQRQALGSHALLRLGLLGLQYTKGAWYWLMICSMRLKMYRKL